MWRDAVGHPTLLVSYSDMVHSKPRLYAVMRGVFEFLKVVRAGNADVAQLDPVRAARCAVDAQSTKVFKRDKGSLSAPRHKVREMPVDPFYVPWAAGAAYQPGEILKAIMEPTASPTAAQPGTRRFGEAVCEYFGEFWRRDLWGDCQASAKLPWSDVYSF